MVGCGIVGTTRALSENRTKTLITRPLPPADKARLVPTSFPLTSPLTSPLCTLHSVLKSPSLRGFVTTKWQLCERTFTWMQFPCEGTIISQSCTYRYRKASQARNNDEDRGLWMVGCGIVGTTRALSENRTKTLITRPLPPADKARLVPTSFPLTSPLTSPLCTLHSVLKSPSLRGFVTTKWQLCERTFTWMQFPCEGTIISQSCTYRYRKASQARNNDEDRGLWMVGCGIVGTTRALSENRTKTLITRPLPPADKARLVPTSFPLPSHLSPLTSNLSLLPSHLFPLPSHLSPLPTHLSPLTSHLSPIYSPLCTNIPPFQEKVYFSRGKK